MKTNITILNTKYKYADSRVVCVIMYRIKPIIFNNIDITNKIFDKKEYHVVGVARCHPKDIFDTTVGERIAESRAKKALFKFLFNSYRNYYIKIKSKLKYINELYLKCYYLADQETKHINKLIYDTK